MSWYGSRLVMYHGGKGGTIFAVGAFITIGGLALGSGFLNLRYFYEASSVGERMMEVINRVPAIDLDCMEGGEILASVSGDVEFKNLIFSYPSRPDNVILQEFSLKIPTGKTIALVGASSSGKG
ncbi:hypothetical protein NE237_030224 [Protea cynaroides]|uniref:Uncharacterized protein n=1 Tax=Protea cynaroides TaxID=273540 RepID=A0A9Q0GSM2_9MAGN|nr:hypothetical protein NE237_030224 [Protea cynaroides]